MLRVVLVLAMGGLNVGARAAPVPLPPAQAGAEAGVQDPATVPAFRGILPMGKDQLALFELPGGNSWTGHVGEVVPGTRWTVRSVSLRPTSVVVEVAGHGRIELAVGETYTGGKGAVPAPVPQSVLPPPEKHPTRAFAQPQRVVRRTAYRPAAPAGAAPAGAQGAPAADVGPPPNYAQVDASGPDRTDLRAYGVSGVETVVMFTSIRCGPCQLTKPKVKEWARAHPQSRVIEAEIGESADHGINWGAPVIKAVGIHGVPYFVILDANGNVSAQGNAAHNVLGF